MGHLTRRSTTALALAAIAAVIAATPASAASEWDLDFTANATQTMNPFGTPDTATYGQTITVPDGPDFIESFSFEIDVPATVVLRGAVQAWDTAASTTVGPVLYLSDPVSTAGTGMETVTFTPNVPVTAGTYVLYATTSYDWSATASAGDWLVDSADPYPGGIFVFFNSGDDESLLTGGAWETRLGSNDAGFTVVFGVTPVTPPVTPPATPVIVAPAYTG